MSIFSDPLGAVSDAANSIVDAVHTIPGVDWAGEQLKDFANSPVGQVVTRAMASAGYVSLAPILGPQLAAISFALPGAMKGDAVTEAWMNETVYRIKTTAEILSGGAGNQLLNNANVTMLTNQIKEAAAPILDVAKQVGAVVKIPGIIPGVSEVIDKDKLAKAIAGNAKLTAKTLAAKMGIREDMAQSAIDLATGKQSFAVPASPAIRIGTVNIPAKPAIPGLTFDAKTGKLVETKGLVTALPGPIAAAVYKATMVGSAQRGEPKGQAQLARAARDKARAKWIGLYLARSKEGGR